MTPSLHRKIRKRYAKRTAIKFIYFIFAVVFGSIIAAKIVEIRLLTLHEKSDDTLGDFIDNIVAAPLKLKIIATKRPRPTAENPQPISKQVMPVESHARRRDASATKPLKPETIFQIPIAVGDKKDWHDYAQMASDRARVGFGENGSAVFIKDASQKELEKTMSMQNGFNAFLSDQISVNRSLPDIRHRDCRLYHYLSKLPTVSIILPFYNEHFSVLVRSLHSIVNRTPKELLKQIIIVDDSSDREYLKKQLDDYVADKFHGLVQIVRLTKRTGLIGTRLAGARKATADVLIFFDSHIECNYNWLPPLLEPIAINPKISTCPLVDNIQHENFGYSGGEQGTRGVFNWKFVYKNLPLLPEDLVNRTRPYRNPVMIGGLFAIDRKFFWELGGYDEGLDIWGGEQFELSFKIWMCGGMLLDVPCSRVAHIFRGPMNARPNPRGHNYIDRNFKRVAEVWMDEYKEYIYKRNRDSYDKIDAGDLTKEKAIRARLKCKSFKWFLEVVAPDMLIAYPPIPPPSYASGVLQSVAYPQFCLDTMNGKQTEAVGLFYCAANKINPQANQLWSLSVHRDVRAHEEYCLDVHESEVNATVWLWFCHMMGGNQFWYYDREYKLLKHGHYGNRCMEAVKEGSKYKVFANECDTSNMRMKWNFGFINHTMLDNFYAELKVN